MNNNNKRETIEPYRNKSDNNRLAIHSESIFLPFNWPTNYLLLLVVALVLPLNADITAIFASRYQHLMLI